MFYLSKPAKAKYSEARGATRRCGYDLLCNFSYSASLYQYHYAKNELDRIAG